MGKVYLDDSFDGRKLEHIELKKKIDAEKMMKQIMDQIEEKLKKKKDPGFDMTIKLSLREKNTEKY